MTDTLTIRAALAEALDGLETIAAQGSGVPGSRALADCMAAIAKLHVDRARLALTAGSAEPDQASEPAGFGGALAFSLGQSRSASPPRPYVSDEDSKGEYAKESLMPFEGAATVMPAANEEPMSPAERKIWAAGWAAALRPTAPLDPRSVDGWLCYAWGETDRPCAQFVTDRSGVEAFIVREWLGDKDSRGGDGEPSLPGIMEEFDEHASDPLAADLEWEFEIGGVRISRCYGFAASPSPTSSAPAEPLRSALERITANYRRTLAGKPVRDVAETLAECDSALASSVPPEQQPEPEQDGPPADLKAWVIERWLGSSSPLAPRAVERRLALRGLA